MQQLRVALLQLLPEGSMEANLRKGLDACRKAKELGAEIALFPELWNIGYNLSSDPAALKKRAVPADGAFVRAFGDLARELEMAIGITFLEEYSPAPRNTLCLFDRFGKKVLTYAKVHTCDSDDERLLTAGDDFFVVGLDTAEGSVKVGAPVVEGASVSAKVIKNGKGKKLNIITYRAKKHSARRMGHRQPFTKVEITAING